MPHPYLGFCPYLPLSSVVTFADWEIGPMCSIAFAPDGMRAAAGSGKGKIVVWDIDL